MARMGGRCQCKEKSTDAFVRYKNLEPALCLELKKIVEAMKSPGKGILAVDESPATLDKKFQEMDITSTESIRRDYRQMLLSTDKTRLNKCISSVILHHETVYQKTSDDVEFIEFVRQKNLIPGVKVDKGLVNLFGTDNETTTQGLDELQERCIQYKKDGCHFTKWRCTFSISDSQPSYLAMLTNANVLARYASISQSARLVPIIEPEILNQGEHGINRSRQVHEEMLSILFRTLNEHRVYLEGIILKPSMVLAGLDHARYCKPQIIAESTVSALQRTVPAAVPMIAFLSGGQTDEETTLNLNAINQYEAVKPWTLTFCFGRALQVCCIEFFELT
ncbi:fructose-bisphosphate aldolase-like [Cephus cinctus]|uniref:Fructose-bisphosphate aldolase n=1 Tax=Cephus cinctus TaxID=211228 RepID=A0AAJ7W092_CEPCN|nr:fructose-bisphosphate aldolase-like [Cephus cinctus]